MPAPTTKKKQRDFLTTLINLIKRDLAGKPEILKALRLLRRHLHNRPPVKRAPPGADPITPAKRRAVINTYRRHPRMRNRDIALAHNIDSGRVSEILAGKRY